WGNTTTTALALEGSKLWLSPGGAGRARTYDAPDIGMVTALHFSADGKKLLASSDRGYYVWDVPAGQLLHPGRLLARGPLASGFTDGATKVAAVELDAEGKLRFSKLSLKGETQPVGVVKPPPMPPNRPDRRLAVPTEEEAQAAEAALHERYKD